MGIGSILKNLRKSYKFSQKYVADCLSISRNAYMAWENGYTQLNLDKLQQICHVYQISLQDLLINGGKRKAAQKPRLRKISIKEKVLETELVEEELFQ